MTLDGERLHLALLRVYVVAFYRPIARPIIRALIRRGTR